MLDDTFDYFNRGQILDLFKNKQPHKIEKYVKVLTGLINKGIQEYSQLNKKYINQVFNGENLTYFNLLKDNLSWLLDKYKYDYSQEQV